MAKCQTKRALSLRGRNWQSVGWPYALSAALLFGAIPAASAATPTGPTNSLSTLPRGTYVCELAGNAQGDAGISAASENFTITHSSSYMVGNDMGTYLLTGNLLTITSGPKQGQTYRRKSENFLRKLAPDGTETSLRCIRGS